MKTRIVTVTFVLDPDKHWEACALSVETLEMWVRKGVFDTHSESAALDDYFTPDAVSVTEIESAV